MSKLGHWSLFWSFCIRYWSFFRSIRSIRN